MPLLLVTVDGPGRPPSFFPLERLPATLGRSARSAVVLDAPGLWDEHLRLAALPDGTIEAAVKPPAVATLDGAPLGSAALRPGHELRCGGLTLRITLGPAQPRSAPFSGRLLWLVLAAVTALQAVLLARLLLHA
jgi:hypothetical protein